MSDFIKLVVKAKPNAHANNVTCLTSGEVIVCVTAPAHKGQANKSVINVLAKTLRLPRSQISLIKGSKSNTKTLALTGITQEELESLLRSLACD